MTSRSGAVVLIACAIMPLLSCISDRTSVQGPAGDDCRVPAGAIGAGRAVVLIRDFSFFPDTLRVRAGTTVTWVNCETAAVDPHTATATGSGWDSGAIPSGDSWARRFETAGEHPYFCRPHAFMKGVVLVEQLVGP